MNGNSVVSVFLACGALAYAGPLVPDRPSLATPGPFLWAVPGERRPGTAMGLVHTNERDRFGIVKSDGRRMVVALGGQPSESPPRQQFFYIIDGAAGHLQSVVPAPKLESYCVGDGYLASLVRTDKACAIQTTRIEDATIIYTLDGLELGLGSVRCLAIAGGLLRVNDPCGSDVYLDLATGQPVDAALAHRRISELVAKGVLDACDPWRIDEAASPYPKGTQVGTLSVMIDLTGCWIVSERFPARTSEPQWKAEGFSATQPARPTDRSPEGAFHALRKAIAEANPDAITQLVYMSLCPPDRARPDAETAKYWLREGVLARELSPLILRQIDTALPRKADDALVRSGLRGAHAVRLVCRESGGDGSPGSQHIRSLYFVQIDGAWRWFRTDAGESWLLDRSDASWAARSICVALRFHDATILYDLLDPQLRSHMDEMQFVNAMFSRLWPRRVERYPNVEPFISFPSGCIYPRFESERLAETNGEAVRVWVLSRAGQRTRSELLVKKDGTWYWRPSEGFIGLIQMAESAPAHKEAD
jgi:hypothetical protein